MVWCAEAHPTLCDGRVKILMERRQGWLAGEEGVRRVILVVHL